MLKIRISLILLHGISVTAFSYDKVIVGVLASFAPPHKLGENFSPGEAELWDNIELHVRYGSRLAAEKYCPSDIAVTDYDTKGTVEGTVAAIKRAESEGAKALVGFVTSGLVLTVNKLYPHRTIPAFTTTATNDEVPGKLPPTLQMAYNNTTEGKALVKAIAKIPKKYLERMYLLTDVTNPFSVQLSQEIKKHYKSLVPELTYSSPLKWAPSHWPLEGLNKATSLIMTGEGEEVLEVVTHLSPLNHDYMVIGGDAWYRGNITGYIRNQDLYVPDTLAMGHWSPRFQDHASRSFVKTYKQRFNATPGGTAAIAYDAVKVICETWKRKKSLEFKNFVGPVFDGLTGKIHFTSEGAQDMKRPSLYWFHDGEYHDQRL